MARFSDAVGTHFPINAYEQVSIFDGIQSELQRTVGTTIKWLVFNRADTEKDAIYHVASDTGGRKWERAVVIPTYAAFVYQGASPHSDRGFWNVDTLRASFAADQVLRAIPDIVASPDSHLKDRILFRGKLFSPNILYLRGVLGNEYTIITIEGQEVTSGESVNDHQMTDNEFPYMVVESQHDEYVSDTTYQPPEDADRLPYPLDLPEPRTVLGSDPHYT